MQNVLLCGCGNIGFRHLQALAAMTDIEPVTVTVIEPQTALHPRIAEFISTAATQSPHRFLLHDRIEAAPPKIDLAIIATNADTRRAAFDALIAHVETRVIIFEKVLFQTLRDIEEVGAILAVAGTKGFVNCGRRGFPGYQNLRTRWAETRPLNLTVTGTDFGIGSNTVHFLDLAEYLNDSPLSSVDLSGLHPGSIAAKREGQVEVFGQVTARLSNGATIDLTCIAENGAPTVELTIEGAGLNARIDEANRQLHIEGVEAPEAFAARHVSEMPHIYAEALRDGRTCLTDYESSARQHRLFLTTMRSHLGLSNDADTPCPIS